ncbi:MAG: iron-sulfur cluster repair di-iron protein [Armatimonadetes bacterium]|nr:iron-sulfur cluster repair di-iron protein [Armatimonadota bacterium]
MVDIHRPVGQLVAERPDLASALERWGIDYCCGGGRSLAAACAAREVSVEEILGSLGESAPSDGTRWDQAGVEELVDHILFTHHAYLRRELPALGERLARVARVHGDNHPELRQLKALFEELSDELLSHMAKEEQILFPAVVNGGHFPLDGPIQVMMLEHDHAGSLLASMRQLSGGFEPPADGCATYRALYAGLDALEKDLHQHIHLENNILFPRVLSGIS